MIILFLCFHLFIKKTFHTEIFIAAKPEQVWRVLLDGSRFQEWNTVLVPIEGKIEQGNKLKYEMTDQNNNKSIISIKVKKAIENKELNQVGGMPSILTFDHKYILRPEKNGTKLIQHEVDRGIGMLFWDSSWIEPAYRRTSENLKKIVEEGKVQ